MEEADLLRERLQAITDKRRIQEDIARKRRQIDEEKLKLQYIKKKALREQWLLDGVGQQTAEEQEATRLQVQHEQQQSDTLQGNIHRMEEEIQALETQELSILANEEAVLKRLKEVERTTEDIIKELKEKPLKVPDGQSFVQVPVGQPDDEEPSTVSLALEISVCLDRRTGTQEVVSSAPLDWGFQPEGLKVYEDGCRSVFALPAGGSVEPPCLGDMSLPELEELLRQASHRPQVRYHGPVYSAPYAGPGRPATPGTQNTLGQVQTPSSCQGKTSSWIGAQVQSEGIWNHEDKYTPQNLSPCFLCMDQYSRVQTGGGRDSSAGESRTESHTPGTRSRGPACSPNPPAHITARSEGLPAPMPALLGLGGGQSPSTASSRSEGDPEVFNRHSHSNAGSVSSLNLVQTLPDPLESEPVTMVFLGYQNAVDQDQDIQAELVIVGNSEDEDEEEALGHEGGGEEDLSYHPQGYRSKVFQPRLGLAQVGGGDLVQDGGPHCEDLGTHKPTFIHNPRKNSPDLQRPEPPTWRGHSPVPLEGTGPEFRTRRGSSPRSSPRASPSSPSLGTWITRSLWAED